MEETVALPVAEVPAGASTAPAEQPAQVEGAQQEGEEPKEAEAKKEKTPEQREIDRQARKIDRLVRQREELRARLGPEGLTPPQNKSNNPAVESEGDTLTLSRAELQRIEADAERRGLTKQEQRAEIEQRAKVVEKLSSSWGREKFDAMANDLNEAFDGLTDRSGKPKPATDAIFECDDPKALIEYLADPDNADEADSISRMGDRQAGRAIAKLELKLAEKAKEAKPQASKVAAPIETGRGSGGTRQAMPDPANTKAYIKWANEQERRARS